MQTRMRLAAFEREWALRAELSRASAESSPDGVAEGSVDLLYASYRGAKEEAGFGKPFDLSPATLKDRWIEGGKAAKRAVRIALGLP